MAFAHDAYTVAWICALPLELAAAKVMLDEVHPPLAQPASDPNTYALGSIGDHNVVVVCSPYGAYGETNTTTSIVHLIMTYQNIQFGLMVGVGGGVPRENSDIRLGDIVVSKPTATSSGVIQFDYGKTIQSGRFHRTGSSNKPPLSLLKVIAQIRSDDRLGKALIGNILTSSLYKEEIDNQFSRPSKDELFQSTYSHAGDRPDCAACDRSYLVVRPKRVAEEPHIHYGLIASGDQLMKDARARDVIAEELDILCFEMTAAGVMDEFPSLVIRGICDYCDSHKYKQWQPYAALVAAAYAKAVLMKVPSQEQRSNPGKIIPAERHWMVPFQRNPGFVGREREIAKVEELFAKTNGPSRVAIYGLGGMGKTQIALELAYRVRERDPRCSVFWIPCTSFATVEQAYMGIAQSVGIQGVKPADVKERVKAYLSQAVIPKWLLIFDNADDMDMWLGDSGGAIELANSLAAQSEQGQFLFTTRNRMLAVRLASPFVIEVSPPDPETGIKIFEKALIRTDLLKDKDATTTLLKQLGYLPLAIIQVAAYINYTNIGLSDYTQLLHEHAIEVLGEGFGGGGRYKGAQNSVAATWLISFRQVERLDQTAADFLLFMACISPRDIPPSLLPQATSFRRKIEAIATLESFSFVSAQSGGKLLSLHLLVYHTTRKWMIENGRFSRQISRTADRLSEVFPDNSPTNRQLWREYLPHGLILIGEREFQKKQGKYLSLVERIGECLCSDGRYDEAEGVFLQLLGYAQEILGRESPITLTSQANLASIYRNQGRWKTAEELELQVLEARIEILGPKHPDSLTSMGSLASTYRSQGRWDEAEDLELQVLEARKEILGPDHPETLAIMHGLASTYQIQGRWKEAEDLALQVLEACKKVLGSDHPDTVTSMHGLASTYLIQGRWKEAEDLELQVLEVRKEVLGPKHPDSLTSMANLASTFRNQGRLEEAEELELQVLEKRKELLGLDHPDTLTSMHGLASTYQIQGRLNQAQYLELQVLKTRKELLGPEHPDSLTSMANLASIFQNQRRWKEAEELQLQVLELRKRVLGPEHPDTLASMHGLASTYMNIGRVKESEELLQHVRAAQQSALNASHPDTQATEDRLVSKPGNQDCFLQHGQPKLLNISEPALSGEYPQSSVRSLPQSSLFDMRGKSMGTIPSSMDATLPTGLYEKSPIAPVSPALSSSDSPENCGSATNSDTSSVKCHEIGSDSETICSTDSGPDDQKLRYIEVFANHLRHDIENVPELPSVSNIPHSYLELILKDFVWKLHGESSNPFQWGAAVILRQKMK